MKNIRRQVDVRVTSGGNGTAAHGGAEIEAIATLQGVAVSTVRTHLKSVFSKLGVSRQLSVAQLARGLPQMRP